MRKGWPLIFIFLFSNLCFGLTLDEAFCEKIQIGVWGDAPSYQVLEKLSGKERKQAFLCFTLPYMIVANDKVLEERGALLEIKEKWDKSEELSTEEELFLERALSRYKVKGGDFWEKLFSRVDMIPISLLLAQSAVESAWGTSRFAKTCNNLYGRWAHRVENEECISKRNPNVKLKYYKDLQKAHIDQIHYLNTHRSYEKLRTLRKKLRQEGYILEGAILSEGLKLYSQKKEEYIKILQSIIKANDFQEYDTYFEDTSVAPLS